MQIMHLFLTTTHYTKAWLHSSPPCTLNINYMFYFLNHQTLILHEDIVVVVSIATFLAGRLEQDVTLQTLVSGMQLIASSHGG